MVGKHTETIIRRSRLIMPANNKRFIERAYSRNADAIVLDLEDSVPIAKKKETRQNIRNIIPVVAKGGSDVIVRINNRRGILEEDIKASVCPELDSIYFPKVEDAHQVEEVDQLLSKLETERGLNNGKIKIGLIIETPKGLINLREIVQSSLRIDTVSLGVEDFSHHTGMNFSEHTKEGLLYAQLEILFAAKAFGKLPLGLLSRISNYNDLDEMKQSAILAYKYGFAGASCIHPKNVEILNASFSPSAEEVNYSLRVITHFEKRLEMGEASATLDGKMIDYVHYKNAKEIVSKNEMIQAFEKKKQGAREKAMGGHYTV